MYQCNFSSSDQLDISLVQYNTHLFLVIFPLALQFSQSFIFRSHRDNFIKFLKIITMSFFLVNNSIQHSIFLQSKAQVSSEITRGRYKAKGITSIICILYVYFFPIFSSFDYNMLHISSLSLLTSRILAINLTPIKFFSKKNT